MPIFGEIEKNQGKIISNDDTVNDTENDTVAGDQIGGRNCGRIEKVGKAGENVLKMVGKAGKSPNSLIWIREVQKKIIVLFHDDRF